MMRFASRLSALSYVCVLRAASLIVPGDARKEWLNEWRGELWQARQTYKAKDSGCLKHTAAFCLGAFQDAACLRSMACSPRAASAHSGSRQRCLICLVFILLVAACGCFLSSKARSAFESAPGRISSLRLITLQGDFGTFQPDIPVGVYRTWAPSPSHFLRDASFYAPRMSSVRMNGSSHQLNLGYASDNLAHLLQLSLPRVRTATATVRAPQVVLSGKAFASLRLRGGLIPEQVISVDGKRALFAGVAPRGILRVLGQLDGFVFADSASPASLPADTQGFALSSAGAQVFQYDAEGRPYLLVQEPRGTALFECLPLAQRRVNPLFVFLFALVTACLALPATTPLTLGEYPKGRTLPALKSRAKRWLFLIEKLALLAPAVGFVSATAAYTWMPPNDSSAVLLQLFGSFGALLFAFRWALHDQRNRCPVCLHRLTSAACVGHPSRSFLAWSGTEMVCPSGHGLLHIPEHPTSWFRVQRWFCLGSSWSELFHENAA